MRPDPFPHLVLDDLWPEDVLQAIVDEFPDPDHPAWKTYGDPRERGKMCCDRPEQWGPRVAAMMSSLTSTSFCEVLSTVTGIGGLVGDVIGGGMHMTGAGGRLGMHVDFNRHPRTGWDRRLNLLVFLNRQWCAEWGGSLLLGRDEAQTRILPLFNRTVVFETSDTSWHGHPEPIVGGRWRRSIACYYYAPPRDADERSHSTRWL